MLNSGTFHASISPKFIDKVTRLWNSSLEDVCHELIQNSRRAGASRINVRCISTEGGPAVAFQDNGSGIADPRTILSLGDSDWDPATVRREAPAGCGIFSLSTRGAIIRSRARNSEAGWSMTLTPDHFTGKTPVTVEPCAMEAGTKIIFPESNPDSVRGALNGAARYCPVAVYFEDEPVAREDFLKDAIHEEMWRGLRIGVLRSDFRYREPTVNFHGLTLETPLPYIREALGGNGYSARIDVIDCPELKLVLPARKEVVQDAFIEEMSVAVTRAIYRAVAREDGHRLPFTDWQEARRLGIELPEANAELRPFEPAVADTDSCHGRQRESVPANACLVDFTADPQEQQCLARALRRSAGDLPLFEPCHDYKGYAWYDRLPRITGMQCFIEEGDRQTEIVLIESDCESSRPDRIVIEATVGEPDGTKRLLKLETDFLVAGDSWSNDLDGVRLFVTRDSDLTPGQLTDLLEAGFFSPSDDADADSYETQCNLFRDEASHKAIAFLGSREEADLALLEEGIRRDLLWLVPCERHTVITIRGREIRIEQTPLPAAEEDQLTASAEGSAGE